VFYVFIVLSSVAYIFLAFKELFYLKQKRNVNTYFNTMIIFFILASVSTLLNDLPGLLYIKNTFLIISILLIIINSIRISWIAFIIKKEKIYLLILSVIIGVLFLVNLINSNENSVHMLLLKSFSPSLEQFSHIIMIYGVIYFSVLFFTTLFHIPTAEAFDRKAAEVTSLQYFSKLVTQVLDFNDLAFTITDITAKVCNADGAWIVLKEKDESRQSRDRLKTIANKNIGYVDANLLTKFIFDTSAEQEKKNENKFSSTTILNINRFELAFKDKTQLSENYFYVAVSPLKTHNEIRGYLIAAKKENFTFDEEDRNAINTFSDYASIAIENSILLEESIEKERLERELDVAREIQRKILPAKNPEYEKLEISSVFIPAFEVGGDYYDFFEIDKNPDKVGTGKIGFIIADVSGKGISAAFIMAELKGIFESLTKTIERPKEILVKANEILKRTLDRKNFVSAVYGVIDFEEEILTLSRAGHCPILLVRNNVAENIRPRGLGLGLNFSRRFEDTLEEIEISLMENDTIVFYTDGITEAKNIEMEDFGDNFFEKILIENADKTANEISNKVIREVTQFSKDNSQHDDITLVIFKWKQKIKMDGDKEWQNSMPQLKTRVV